MVICFECLACFIFNADMLESVGTVVNAELYLVSMVGVFVAVSV